MKSAINIGASEQTVNVVGGAILAILKSDADQKTIRAALTVLTKACQVSNVSISDCQFTVEAEPVVPAQREW
jgi:hypothetical protein